MCNSVIWSFSHFRRVGQEYQRACITEVHWKHLVHTTRTAAIVNKISQPSPHAPWLMFNFYLSETYCRNPIILAVQPRIWIALYKHHFQNIWSHAIPLVTQILICGVTSLVSTLILLCGASGPEMYWVARKFHAPQPCLWNTQNSFLLFMFSSHNNFPTNTSESLAGL